MTFINIYTSNARGYNDIISTIIVLYLQRENTIEVKASNTPLSLINGSSTQKNQQVWG
jgi:hypothetical protein